MDRNPGAPYKATVRDSFSGNTIELIVVGCPLSRPLIGAHEPYVVRFGSPPGIIYPRRRLAPPLARRNPATPHELSEIAENCRQFSWLDPPRQKRAHPGHSSKLGRAGAAGPAERKLTRVSLRAARRCARNVSLELRGQVSPAASNCRVCSGNYGASKHPFENVLATRPAKQSNRKSAFAEQRPRTLGIFV